MRFFGQHGARRHEGVMLPSNDRGLVFLLMWWLVLSAHSITFPSVRWLKACELLIKPVDYSHNVNSCLLHSMCYFPQVAQLFRGRLCRDGTGLTAYCVHHRRYDKESMRCSIFIFLHYRTAQGMMNGNDSRIVTIIFNTFWWRHLQV
jgi:hypothetical protein